MPRLPPHLRRRCYCVLAIEKALAYQFGLATIRSLQDHSHMYYSDMDKPKSTLNQLINKYYMRTFAHLIGCLYCT